MFSTVYVVKKRRNNSSTVVFHLLLGFIRPPQRLEFHECQIPKIIRPQPQLTYGCGPHCKPIDLSVAGVVTYAAGV